MKVLFLLIMVCSTCLLNAQSKWAKAEGINHEMSITSLQKHNDSIIAFGQRQWREGMAFLSEPKAYISVDNGCSWKEFDMKYNGNSTANTLLISDNRIITSGRKGDVQLDWVGAVLYTDDNGNTWHEVSSIPSDVSITKIVKNGNKLVAFGQRQWREGTVFFSEPKSYISEDNGCSWRPFVTITPELSTTNSLIIKNGRVITSGREGPTQVEWVGAIYYTDDNGSTWVKAQGLPKDIAISDIVSYGDKLIAGGQRQWLENGQFQTKSLVYVSDDNGNTWTLLMEITDELSSALPICVSNGRIMTAGRLGPAQLDWVGALFYADFNCI